MADGRKSHREHRGDPRPAARRPQAAGGEAAEAATAATEEPSDRIAQLESALAEAETERETYLDNLRRLQAEFDNYRKRVRRDEEMLRKCAGEDVVEALLPVVDNMQRACEAAEHHDEGQVVEGVERVTDQMCSLLGQHGLEEIAAAPGDPFDPTTQEAVMAQPSDEIEEGHIIAVTQRGYMLHDKLLRAARVVVSSGPPAG